MPCPVDPYNIEGIRQFVVVALLAELHGRCGYFPAHVRLRRVEGTIPPEYEVAEVLDLQEIRDQARDRRE